MSKIAALQLSTLPLSDARLDYYLKACKDSGANLVVLGEYVLNSFFTELCAMSKQLIKEQSESKKASLAEFAKKSRLFCICPPFFVNHASIITQDNELQQGFQRI